MNAFDRGDALIVDACVFSRFSFGEEFGYAGPRRPFDPSLPDQRPPQRLVRVTVPADADEATWELLAPHGVDFPRIHPDREGRAAPWMVGACRADPAFSDPFDSVLRVDLERPGSPTLWTAPQGFVGEPLIAPHAEGDHVLCLVSDGLAERTTLVVLRLDALDDGPVAEVPLPLLPVAFHGDWVAPGTPV